MPIRSSFFNALPPQRASISGAARSRPSTSTRTLTRFSPRARNSTEPARSSALLQHRTPATPTRRPQQKGATQMGLDRWSKAEGMPVPLGATWLESAQACNFTLYSNEATAVTLLLYGDSDFVHPLKTFVLEFPSHKTSRVWHVMVPAAELDGAKYYAFKVDGPFDPPRGARFDRDKILLDSYVRGVFLPPDFSRVAAI